MGSKIRLAILAVIVCIGLSSRAQHEVNGTVIDAESSMPIAGAVVALEAPGPLEQITDETGYFSFYLDAIPEYIAISHVNYSDTIYVSPNQLSDLTIRLTARTNLLGNAETNMCAVCVVRTREPSPLTVVTRSTLDIGDQSSLEGALNTVPGVKFEERGNGGSRRINIRGSFIRSPFAVRNIKMYWEGIPLTSPDGSSPLELIDSEDVANIGVIKGPKGSAFGTANGGVIGFRGIRAPYGKKGLSISTGISVGSFGFLRSRSSAMYADQKLNVVASFIHQQTNGYRSQEANQRQQINLFGHYYFSPASTLNFYATNYDGYWELPGSISAESVEDDPTQAIAFSEEGNASVSRDRTRIGLSHEWRITERLKNFTAVYTNQTDKQNPYGTSPFFNGYKDEYASGYGGRTVFEFNQTIHTWLKNFNARLGGEYQEETLDLIEWTNELGDPGELKYENQTTSINWFAFAEGKIEHENWILEAGASVNDLTFQTIGITHADSVTAFNTTLDQDLVFLPRVGTSSRIYKELWAFGSLSMGHSYPSLFEMLNTDNGNLNPTLMGESGLSAEAGLKGWWLDSKLYAEASVYQFNLDNTIVSAGDDLFENIGKTDQFGMEWAVMASIIDLGTGFIKELDFINSGQWHHYLFRDQANDEISNNYLTGVPLAAVKNILSAEFRYGFKLGIRHHWYDKAPMNNTNSAWHHAYNVVNLRAGWTLDRNRVKLNLFAGINNLTDTQYSSFIQLNGFGGRFFNPSPERNYFGGASLSVNL